MSTICFFGLVAMVTAQILGKKAFSKTHHDIYHWKDKFMLINICNRTDVQK